MHDLWVSLRQDAMQRLEDAARRQDPREFLVVLQYLRWIREAEQGVQRYREALRFAIMAAARSKNQRTLGAAAPKIDGRRLDSLTPRPLVP